ncbi:MAG TPA: NosD domain-containing protein [Blastocatellia bacterium]|nr:NosD domain-containing protein [Blastocatellia bacterium]
MNISTRKINRQPRLGAIIRFSICAAALLFTALTWQAEAAPLQAFVSVTRGDDGSDCSADKPCKTIGHALSVVPGGGRVVIIDSGEYEPFSISRSVTVQTAPGVYAGVVAATAGGSGIFIGAASADSVTLRGLTVIGAGSGIGINLSSGGVLRVEDCVVADFNVQSARGISVTADSRLFLSGTVVKGCGTGVFIGTSSGEVKAAIENCRIEENSIGLNSATNARVTARGSLFAGNSSRGILGAPVSTIGSDLTLEGCVISGNAIGIETHVAANIRVSNSTVTNNGTGLSVLGGTILTRGNNTVENNSSNGSFSGTYTAK